MHEKRNKHRSSLEMRKAANQEGRGSAWCQVWAWLPRCWETNEPQKLVVGWAAQGPLGGTAQPAAAPPGGRPWAPSCWCLSLEGGRSPRCGPLFPRDELMSAAPYVMSLQEKVQLLSETCCVFFKWPKSPKEHGERHNHRVSGFPVSLLEDAELVVVEHVPPSPTSLPRPKTSFCPISS